MAFKLPPGYLYIWAGVGSMAVGPKWGYFGESPSILTYFCLRPPHIAI